MITHKPRVTLPERVAGLLTEWNVMRLFANIEHEVDELRRDIRVCELAELAGEIQCVFLHDKCIIPPGVVTTKEGRAYSV